MSWFNRSRKIKLRGSREEIRQLAHDLADHKIKIEELEKNYDAYTVNQILKLASLLVQGIDADWLFT